MATEPRLAPPRKTPTPHRTLALNNDICLFRYENRKICSKMITNNIRCHTAIHYIMSITRNRFRPYWVSSGGCKEHSIINMLKKQICHWVHKYAIQDNMIQLYLYHGGHIQGHTHTHTRDGQQVTSVNPKRDAGSLSRHIIL